MSPTSATSHECPSLQPAEMGILAELRCPDVEMRIAILEMKAAAEQADIPRDVLEFLATRIESNIRVLEGALFKICAYSSLNQVELALPLVEEIVADYSTDGTERRVTMQEIVDYVHERMNCQVADIIGPKRSKGIAWPRQIAVYLCRELTDDSLAEIGAYFGGRDHSTILYGYNKVAELVAEDQEVLWLMNDMKTALRDP